MASFVNGCVFTATSSGTGSFVVSAAVTGWQTPAQAGASNGATYRYRAYSADNTQWEIGSGVYTTGTVTLTRALIEASSNGGSATNFTLPPAVALTMFDEDIVPFASPTFTGAPASTTAAVDTNTTQIATTAYVVAQAAAATPLGNAATAVVGTSTRYARADHVHPGREVLTANRTYYVATTGSDSNNGLTVGTPFLTIDRAITVAAALDLSVYDVTISVGAGTFGRFTLKSTLGAGLVTINGAGATTIIDTTSQANILATDILGRWRVTGVKFTNSGSAFATIFVRNAALILGAVDFGTCVADHIYAAPNSYVLQDASYTISGSAPRHLRVEAAVLRGEGLTVTLTGTPAFSTAFLVGETGGMALVGANTYSGAATGKRYDLTGNSVGRTYGGGASYLPGNVAGTTATGGQYI